MTTKQPPAKKPPIANKATDGKARTWSRSGTVDPGRPRKASNSGAAFSTKSTNANGNSTARTTRPTNKELAPISSTPQKGLAGEHR